MVVITLGLWWIVVIKDTIRGDYAEHSVYLWIDKKGRVQKKEQR